MLPATLVMTDGWGQAKSGRLPRPIRTDGTTRILTPAPGGIYYWPDPATFVVYYNHLGQSVPPPGLILLSTIGASLMQIADAGGQCTVEIDRVPRVRP